ncbi:putative nuclease HARBI1 [Gigantopelta aegis]|uniref:putative nuclease HARBI1 n=1 Tax=Gigantopelta aegis TaxID=1735272 RepID=UPI001B88BB3F|nr:putative nuclease HARBI1 [Gigantopelta aegis]
MTVCLKNVLECDFALQKNTVRNVTDMVRQDIEQPTRQNHAVSSELQVLIALRFYATGGFQLTMADVHGLSQTTVCNVLKRVTIAIARLRPHYIAFPNNVELDSVKPRFLNIAGFPNCVGAIDCSHIRIIGQGDNGQRFINRKGWSSINVQAVSDTNHTFVNIVAHWHGSVHDSRIFDNSLLKQKFEDGDIDGLLIGDSGYPRLPYLMTPLLNPRDAANNRYNRALCSTRNLVECMFGIWKRRFPCLTYTLRFKDIRISLAVIIATAVLHNIAVAEREPNFNDDLDDPPPPLRINGVQYGRGNAVRRAMIQQYFS